MAAIIDIIASVSFLWITNLFNDPETLKLSSSTRSSSIFSYVKKSLINTFTRHEQHNYGLFTTHSNKYSSWDKIGVGGIWIEPSSYASSLSGVGFWIICIMIVVDLMRNKTRSHRSWHRITSTMLLIIAYILFSGIIEHLLQDWHPSHHRKYQDSLYDRWSADHIESTILIITLFIAPSITWYYVLMMLERLNINIVTYGHARICLSCFLWATVACHLSFLTNYRPSYGYEDSFIWSGAKLEYRQISLGFVPLLAVMSNAPGIVGYILGYIIASIL